MDNTVDITILMPAYNADNFIEKSIESIINQTFKNWELLIADDCSTDNTFNIISNYAKADTRIKVFRQEENLGYLLNCNSIWEKASGKYITFQDADDWSDLNRLEIQYNFMLKNSNIDICSTNYFRTQDERTLIEYKNNEPFIHDTINKFLTEKIEFPLFPGSLFFKKEVSDKIGYYKPFFSRKCGEDWDWILRANRTFNLRNISASLYYYRENPRGVTQNITIDKVINETLVKNIHLQYLEKNIELLDIENKEQLLELENSLKAPFIKDKSLIYYIKVQNAIYHKLYKKALLDILKTIGYNPFKLTYYKTLKYILFKLVF